MKKIIYIGLFLLLLVGCSGRENPTETNETKIENKSEDPSVILKFVGTKLFVANNSTDAIMILDSETEISIKEDEKWILAYKQESALAISYVVLSGELSIVEENLSKIQAEESKITIYYQHGYVSEDYFSKSIIYKK